MTIQEKLQILENQIRKDLPRLMKPIEGCFMNLHYIDEKNKETIEICKIIGINKKDELLIRYDDGFNTYQRKN